jgi:hypothetical protein
VIRWHRRGFRAYRRRKSRYVGGRPRIDSEMRALIWKMSHENPLWGAPRIHGELLKAFPAQSHCRQASLDLFVVHTIVQAALRLGDPA